MQRISRVFRAVESRYGWRTDKSKGSGQMSDQVTDVVDVEDRERLVEEISLLRGKVARIGGDEFGILLESSDEHDAHDTASRLIAQICGCEFLHDGETLPLSVAIGVGMIDALDTPDSVMERADEAMYRRKAAA